MTMRFNLKYEESGSIFQGSVKGKIVDSDAYLRYVASYLMVKNVLELYPGGLARALDNFNDAWEWACSYQFSSMGHYAAGVPCPPLTLTSNILKEIYSDNAQFKAGAHEMLAIHMDMRNKDFDSLNLEHW
jgi:hypothetical protein